MSLRPVRLLTILIDENSVLFFAANLRQENGQILLLLGVYSLLESRINESGSSGVSGAHLISVEQLALVAVSYPESTIGSAASAVRDGSNETRAGQEQAARCAETGGSQSRTRRLRAANLRTLTNSPRSTDAEHFARITKLVVTTLHALGIQLGQSMHDQIRNN